jgi:hypothetical protein
VQPVSVSNAKFSEFLADLVKSSLEIFNEISKTIAKNIDVKLDHYA